MNRIDPAVEPMSPEWCRLALPLFTAFLRVRDPVFFLTDSMVREKDREDKDKSMPPQQATTMVLLRAAVDQQHTEECCSNSLARLSDLQLATLRKLGTRTINAITAYQLRIPLDKEGLGVARMLRQDPGMKSLVAPDVPLLIALRMARAAVLSSSHERGLAAGCFEVYSNAERNGKWFVRMEPNKSSSSQGSSNSSNSSNSKSSNSFVQSLTTDEEGAYSVTGRKAARIMANLLHQAWKGVMSTSARKEPTSKCFDLSAGVGGSSFELGKVFDSVVAFELDQERCGMLRANLQHQGVGSVVTCVCADSVDALRKLSIGRNSSNSSSNSSSNNSSSRRSALAAVLDPPWGGKHYNKSKAREDILFSGLSMSEFVAEFVGKSKALCVLGIKLPLSFDITGDLAEKLSDVGGVRMYACKKIFQQRFVVFVAECD